MSEETDMPARSLDETIAAIVEDYDRKGDVETLLFGVGVILNVLAEHYIELRRFELDYNEPISEFLGGTKETLDEAFGVVGKWKTGEADKRKRWSRYGRDIFLQVSMLIHPDNPNGKISQAKAFELIADEIPVSSSTAKNIFHWYRREKAPIVFQIIDAAKSDGYDITFADADSLISIWDKKI